MQIVETRLQFNSGLRLRSRTTRVIVHHSATPGDVSATTIHGWHLNQGWAGIGYHFVIRTDGTVERGRPEKYIGSHSGVTGNPDSIGVCFAGNFMSHEPTQAQIQGFIELYRYLVNKYGQLGIIGHRDVMPTACPGTMFPMARVRQLAAQPTPGTESGINLVIQGMAYPGAFLDPGGMSWAPVRLVAETLGCQVGWDGRRVLINGHPIEIPVRMIADTSYAPVRALAEYLGARVTWDDVTHTAIIER